MTEDPTRDPFFTEEIENRAREIIAGGVNPYNKEEAGDEYISDSVASQDDIVDGNSSFNSEKYMNRMEVYQRFLDRNRHLHGTSHDEMYFYKFSELVNTFPWKFGKGRVQDLTKRSKSDVSYLFDRRIDYTKEYVDKNSPSSRT